MKTNILSPLQSWRLLAGTFHLTGRLVIRGSLPEGYEPTDAIELCKNVPLTTNERSILTFLLHVWNRYDFSFELSEVAGWDPRHQRAFAAWVNGQTLGRPLRYF